MASVLASLDRFMAGALNGIKRQAGRQTGECSFLSSSSSVSVAIFASFLFGCTWHFGALN